MRLQTKSTLGKKDGDLLVLVTKCCLYQSAVFNRRCAVGDKSTLQEQVQHLKVAAANRFRGC